MLRRGEIITKNDSYYYQRWYDIEEVDAELNMEMEGDGNDSEEGEIQMEIIRSPKKKWRKSIGMVNTIKSERFSDE